MYNLKIDFKKLRDDLIPMYKELNVLFKVSVIPVIQLYNQFISYRRLTHKEIRYNGQVMYLQKALNDRFDTNLIKIIDGSNLADTYIYRKIEHKELVLYHKSENEGETSIYRKSEYSNLIDFIVEAPILLNLTSVEIIELQAIVNKYKLPNKNYKIEMI